jgi:hypothetical protein
VQAYVYGEIKKLPDQFADYVDPAHTAVISIDMHSGHLADDPDCPCPAPRARDITEPINTFHRAARVKASGSST